MLPGPPCVSSQTVSKLLNVQIVESKVATAMTKRKLGNVIAVNFCQALAPSISAASYISASMEERPARMLTVKKGMPAQTLTAMTEAMAVLGVESQATGVLMMPSARRMGFRPP